MTDEKQEPGKVAKAAEFAGKHPTLTLAVNSAVTFGVFTVFAWLISAGLRHGFHLSTGYFGLALVSYFGLTALRFVTGHLAKAHAKAKTIGAAEGEMAVTMQRLQALSKMPGGLESVLGSLGASAAGASSVGGNYL